MTMIHPTTIDAKVKLLYSKADGRVQHPHGDDIEMVECNEPVRHEDKSFTMIVALEPTTNSTSILMGKRIKEFQNQAKNVQPTYINHTVCLAQ
jgi:hypothetical protein